jgi:hypothetical protein
MIGGHAYTRSCEVDLHTRRVGGQAIVGTRSVASIASTSAPIIDARSPVCAMSGPIRILSSNEVPRCQVV